MPELPDVLAYCRALGPRIIDRPLESCRIVSPFFLRSVDVDPESCIGRHVIGVRNIAKRLVIELEGDVFFVIHLMIAGRLRWFGLDAKPPGKIVQATFGFSEGRLAVTEAGSKKRASLHVVQGAEALSTFHRGGVDPLAVTAAEFQTMLARSGRTLKRWLTDPTVLAGIGNAYSDEILHAACLSPFKSCAKLDESQIERLHRAMRQTLQIWIDRLAERFERRFPGAGDITAFRPEFAVHGKFGEPCPVCATRVERIRFVDREFNYCPRCQTGGKILADRSLSRLLGEDWPKTVDDT